MKTLCTETTTDGNSNRIIKNIKAEKKCYLLWHNKPLPTKPWLHIQVKFPALFEQLALLEQGLLAHSSTSEFNNKYEYTQHSIVNVFIVKQKIVLKNCLLENFYGNENTNCNKNCLGIFFYEEENQNS